MQRGLIICVLMGLLMYPPSSANAQLITQNEVKAAVNSLNFIRGLHSKGGRLKLAVVYDPSVAISQNDADVMMQVLQKQSSLKVGNLQPKLVPVSELQTLPDYNVVMVARGVRNYYTGISSLLQGGNHIFAMSTDESCVVSHFCVLAVQPGQGVNILLNEEIMKKQGFDVNAAFRFMVKKI